jgi:hypothetical protein
VTGSPAPRAGLQVGDVIRQANGRRTATCRDLETTAAEALAKGLVLLMAAERDGRLLAAALEPTGAAVVTATEAPAPPRVEPQGTTAKEAAPAPPVVMPAPVAPPPVPTPVATPVVIREAPLPPRTGAAPDLAAKAVAASAVLATIDEAARFAVPIGVYERRIEDAKNAIAALHIEGEGSSAVRDVIAEATGYHEAARDIRRYKSAQLKDARIDERGVGAQSLPYFSDSEVPRWVERYPFLSESLQQAPRTTHMLLPGEMAGRWNPDQAVELLWERAAKASARLGTWGAGK